MFESTVDYLGFSIIGYSGLVVNSNDDKSSNDDAFTETIKEVRLYQVHLRCILDADFANIGKARSLRS